MPYDGSRDDDKPVLPTGWRGSTAFNSTIKSYEDLAYRVKANLGFPVSDLEATDEQMSIYIDEALEWYSEWAGYERMFLMFCDRVYKPGCGVKLDDIVYQTCCMSSECFLPTESFQVTSTTVSGYRVGIESAYLSAAPFTYPANLSLDPAVAVRPTTGQHVHFKFDSQNPWDMSSICNANCAIVRPQNSQWYQLSSSIDNINFTNLVLSYPALSSFLDNPTISALGPVVPTSSVPVNVLTAVPVEFFPVSAFYPENTNVYFPVSGCINIKDGVGIAYPNCNKSLVNTCAALSTVWNIDPNFSYIPIDSALNPYIYLNSSNVQVTATNAPRLSSSTEGIIKNDLNCISFLSGSNGIVINPTDISIKSGTHLDIPGIPLCTVGGTIPLTNNTGHYATFTLCNSAIDTHGPLPVYNMQFEIDHKLPGDIANTTICGLDHSGFLITKHLSAYGMCFTHTPRWVPVDLEFRKQTTIQNFGTVSVPASSRTDTDLDARRKVTEVYSLEADMGGGALMGSNILFSFDYALIANTFGYDLVGNRNFYRNGYDMLTYELARGFIDRVRRMVRYHSFEFNADTQYLKIVPEPRQPVSFLSNSCKRCYAVGAYVEKPIKELINKKWVQEFVTARLMQSVGYIRAKFGTVTLFGGATVQGDTLVSMGNEMYERLLAELREGNYYQEPPQFFIG